MTVPLHLAHEHRSLNHREAEVGELLLAHQRIEPTARLLLDEERGDLRFRDFEDQTEILADQFIVFRYFVSDGAERTPAGHPMALLQRELRAEPALQIVPRSNLIVEWAASVPDRV